MKTLKNKKIDILPILALFILLFNPPLLPINTMHVVGFLSIFYLFLNRKHVLKGLEIELLLAFSVLFFYLFFTVAIHGQPLINSLYPVYFIIDILPFAMAYKAHGEKKQYSFDDYFQNIVAACIVESITSLSAFLVPPIQTYFANRLISYGYGDVIKELMKYRIYGFSGELTFVTPILLSVISVYLLMGEHSSNKVLDKVLALVFIICGIINARVALIVLIVGLFVYIALVKRSVKFKVMSVLGMFVMWIAVANVLLPWLRDNAYETYVWIKYGIDDILSIFGGAKVSDSYSYFSYFSDKNVFKLPSNFMEFLFGIGTPLMGHKDVLGFSSDIGYINDMWLGGIIYCIINYFIWMRIFIKQFIKNDNTKSFGVFILILCAVLNIKGSIFSNNGFTYFLIILAIVMNNDTAKNYIVDKV